MPRLKWSHRSRKETYSWSSNTTDEDEYTLELEMGLPVCKLRGCVGAVGDEGGDPGDARDLVDDDSLLQRIMKLCLFPECPVIASSLDKGSELFDATGLLTRPS